MPSDSCPRCGAAKWLCASRINWGGEFIQSVQCKDRQLEQQAAEIERLKQLLERALPYLDGYGPSGIRSEIQAVLGSKE